MLISSQNKIKYFQVTFLLVLPSSLLNFPNQLTKELNTALWCFLVQLNGINDSEWGTPRLSILEADATPSTLYSKISSIQMAHHRNSSLYGRGIADLMNLFSKKNPT